MGHLPSTNAFIVVLFSASLLLKKLIDGEKELFMWTSKLSQHKGCFQPGLHGLKVEAVEACSETVHLSKVLPIAFAGFAKELVFHHQAGCMSANDQPV